MSADPPQKRVTSISDIARLAGVSASTVSRALAGSKMISAGTRNRINDLAREHGFQLNQMARNLRLKRTNAIGVLLPIAHGVGQFVSDPFFITMLGHVADGVVARGYDLLLTRIVPDDDRWLDILVSSGRVDGVIVIGQSNQEQVLTRVAGNYRPIIVWGQRAEEQAYCTVGTDNLAGGLTATRHLLASGRRNILFAGRTSVPEIRLRHQGFLAAHREAGVEPAGLIPAPLTPNDAHMLLAEQLADHPAIDGIVAASDVVGIAAIRALSDAGRRVPDDVAVVGYDDVPLASQVTPGLTTMRQDIKRSAEYLVELLFLRMNGGDGESVIMQPELIIRGSAP